MQSRLMVWKYLMLFLGQRISFAAKPAPLAFFIIVAVVFWAFVTVTKVWKHFNVTSNIKSEGNVNYTLHIMSASMIIIFLLLYQTILSSSKQKGKRYLIRMYHQKTCELFIWIQKNRDDSSTAIWNIYRYTNM